MFKSLNRLSFHARVFRGALVYILVLQLMQPWRGHANPIGGNVIAGQANIHGGAGTLTVAQASQRAIINWQDFSIQQGELTKFVQPNAASAVLNRVVGSNLSGLYGTLQANGQVYLINPNGIVIGPTGVVNTGGFVASTLDVDPQQFMAGGDLTFKGNSTAKVVNLGKIGAATGDVIMIAQEVENHGEIKAPNGKAALAAGNEVLVKASGQERIFVQAGKGKVSNSGLIESATAELKAAGGNEYALAINNTGTVRAEGAVNEGGRILLKANTGKIKNSGALTAKGTKNAKAEVKVLAEKVELTNSSKVEASGGGFVELSGYGQLKYGGSVKTEGGKVLIDPAVLTIAASGGDMTAADVVALLNDSDTTLQADDILNIDELIDASGNTNAYNLMLDTVTLNLNEGITLVTGATISGTATTVNVGEFGFVQNGIDAVAAGGTVNLGNVTYTLTQQLNIGKSLTLNGGAGGTTLDANASSSDYRRVMQIDRTVAGITVILDGLTLTHGFIASEGGGLLIEGAAGGSATVSILNSRILENFGGAAGGGISVGSSTSSEGDLTLLIRNSTIAYNTSLTSGGGLNILQTGGSVDATIENSTFNNNGAPIGAGILSSANDIGAPTPPSIALNISNSTFTGNSGGLAGILYTADSTVTILNSTLSGNAASVAGGIYVAGGSVSVGGSILSGNIGSGGSESNVSIAGGSFTSLDYNLYGQNGDAGGFTGAMPDDILLGESIDTVLAPLANNGGPTETMALITGSTAAYMKGGLGVIGQLDQRGQTRGPVISIGAYDFDVADLEAVVTTADDEMGNAIGGSELSLREAIWYSNSGILDNPTITFDENGVFGSAQTITLSSSLGQLHITASQSIVGSEAGVTINANASSTDQRRVMQITGSVAGITVTLDRLTLTGGVSDNGGGLNISADASRKTDVTILNSTISGNTGLLQGGGGIYHNGSNGGNAVLKISNSTIAGNATNGGGGGGIYNNGSSAGFAKLTINNSTVAGNAAAFFGEGGGISSFGFGGNAELTLGSTILIGNTGFSRGDYSGSWDTLISTGYNLYGSVGSSGTVSWVTAGSGADLALGGTAVKSVLATDASSSLPNQILLADNGGPTQTIALVTGSAAYLKGGPNSGGQLDQRGQARGSVISIGAWDYDSALLTPVVNTTDDTFGNVIDGPDISLRDAIWYANSGILDNPTITFDESGVFFNPQTITLSSSLGQLLINSSLSIVGSSAGVTIDANASSTDQRRVMQIDRVIGGIDVTLDGLTLTGGYVGTVGGGLLINGLVGGSAAVTVNNSRIIGNRANSGGGIALSGISAGDGDVVLVIRNSTVSDNIAATGSGGAIYVLQDRGAVEMEIENSTISGNQAGGNGGALYLYAADYSATSLSSIEWTVRNSTITGNQATSAGVIRLLGSIGGTVSGTILNSTITDNTSGLGALDVQNRASLSLGGSIVAGNLDTSAAEADLSVTGTGTFTSLGNNLYGQNGGAGGFTGAQPTDILLTGSIDSVLNPLADNGGLTQTMALITGSAAYLKGGANSGGQLDQRGVSRGSVISIGAWDYNAANLSTVVNTTDDTFGNVIGSTDLTLRDAIWYANVGAYSNPTITFDEAGVFSTAQTIVLALGQLSLTASQSILGSAAGVTIDANQLSRVMSITGSGSGVTVELDSLNMTGGLVSGVAGGGLAIDAIGGGQTNVTIRNSAIYENAASGYWGGGISNRESSGNAVLTIINSTIAGNSSNDGGGIHNRGAAAVLNVIDSTITGNWAFYGGGIYSSSSLVDIRGSILAGNTAGTGADYRGAEAGSVLTSQGYNLYGTTAIRDGATVSFNGPGEIALGSTPISSVLQWDTVNDKPVLANNGGPTLTISLVTGSIAIEGGGPNTGYQVDQRGLARKAIMDIGAYETDAWNPYLVTLSGDTSTNTAGELRTAINYANANPSARPTITFDESGIFSGAQTITLTLGQLTLTASQSILGSAAGVTIDADGLSRVMEITGNNTGVTVALDRLTLTGGALASTDGGGLFIAAGSGRKAEVTLSNSSIVNNRARSGGGIYNSGVSGNARLTILNSTIADNITTSLAGGIYNSGEIVMRNSTMAGNKSVTLGGAIYNSGFFGYATLDVSGSTITGNTGGSGGGIHSNADNGFARVTIEGTILAGNNSTIAGREDYWEANGATLVSLGNNLYGQNGASGGYVPTTAAPVGNEDIMLMNSIATVVQTDSGNKPLLADNGGPTKTIALVASSVAYMGGAYDGNTTYDQRGVLRGLNKSIGAWDLDISSLAGMGLEPLVTNAGDKPSVIGTTDLSLRDAMWYSNLGIFGIAPEIEFDEAGVFATAQTINLLHGQLEINQDIAIYGSVAGVTIDAGGSSRVIQINGSSIGTFVELEDLVLTGGSTSGVLGDASDPANYGGGIYVSAGEFELASVHLHNTTVQNSSAAWGGGIALNSQNGGIISLLLERAVVSGNTASQSGGGVYAQASGLGGGVALETENASIMGNTATEHGGGLAMVTGSGAAAIGELVFATFGNNQAGGMGGGIYLSAAAGSAAGVFIGNVTIANNQAGTNGGGIALLADTTLPSAAVVEMVNSTLTGNVAGTAGGGIYYDAGQYGSVVSGGNIVAGNSVDDGINPVVESDYVQGAGSTLNVLQTLGWNLYGQNGDNGGFVANPIPGAGADILLTTGIGTVVQTDFSGKVVLANNGGPTMTVALVLGSVAIDAGNPASGALIDQRGIGRGPLGNFTGTTDDIGAYEAQVIRITADDQNITYGDAEPAYTYSITNSGDATGLLSGDPAAVSYTGNAGTYVIGQGALTSLDSNYLVAFTDGALVVDQRAITVSIDDFDRVYDGTTDVVGATAVVTLGDLVTGDTLSGGTFTFDNRNVGTGKTVTVSGVTVADGNSGNNYLVTLEDNTNSSISVADLVVTAQADSRVYDGTTDSGVGPVVTGTLYDAVGTAATQAFDNKNVGTGKTLTASGLVINDGNGGNNYSITYVDDTTGEITAAALTVTAQTDNRVYDGTIDSSVGPVVTGMLYDAVGTAATQVFDDRNVGTGKTLTASGLVINDGNGGNNYSVTYVNDTTGEITAAALTVTAQTDSRGYNGSNNSAVGPVVTGTTYDVVTTAATQVFDNKNVGTSKTLTASGLVINDGNGGNNYSITYVDDTTGEITAAALTVTAQTDSRGYDGTIDSAVGPVVTGTLYDAVGTVATQAFANKNVGTGKTLTASGLVINDGNGGNNYSISYVDDTTGEITAAALTVTAQTDGRGYDGTTDSAMGPVVTGTLYDAVGTAATQAFDNKNVGTGKTLAASGLVMNDGNGGNNYAITYVDNMTGVITAANLTVTAQADNRVYNGTVGSSMAPVVAGTLYDAIGTAATQIFDTKDVGTGKALTAAGLVMNDGNGGNNYAISYVDDTTGVITQATLIISADAGQSKVYGNADPALAFTATGLFGGDAITGAQLRSIGENVGAYAISQGSLDAGSNYLINYSGANFAVTPRPITVTAGSGVSNYGTNPANPGIFLTGGSMAFAETLALLGIGNDFGINSSTDIGAYVIQVTGGNANYAITRVNGRWLVGNQGDTLSQIFADFQAGEANDENDTVDGVTNFVGSGKAFLTFGSGGAKVPGALVHISSGEVE